MKPYATPAALPFWSRLHGGLDHVLTWLLIYALPGAVLVLSLWALFTWAPHFAHDDPRPVAMRVLEDAGADLGPAAALAALEAGERLTEF